MLNVEEALQELGQKSLNDIQKETAVKWASRAAASFQNCLSETGTKKMVCWSVGEEYAHEAVEHAALVEGEDMVSVIKQELEQYRQAAAQSLDQLFEEKAVPSEQNP